jgi:hypothetical protein
MSSGGNLSGVAERLAESLVGSGLVGSSHKSQYIRWMLGRVRGDREGEDTTPAEGDLYRRPYSKDPKRKPIAKSHPLDTEWAGWSPDPKAEGQYRGQFPPFKPERVPKENRSKFIQALIPSINPKNVVRLPREADELPKGKLSYKDLDKAIIYLYKKEKLTTRAIVKRLLEDYQLSSSQPTVARRIKAFNDGKIDANGAPIKR